MAAVEPSAGARLRRGLAWSGLASSATHVINLLRVMIVARILAPEDFGLFGMAMVVLLGATSLGQLGFKEALIAHDQADEAERRRWLHSLWTGNLLLNVGLALTIAALAWPAAQLYEQPALVGMLLALSLVPVLTALKNPELMALEKRIAFGAIAAVELTVAVTGLVFTVLLAWWLGSAWALVYGQLLAPAGGLALSYWVVRGRPVLAWDSDALRQAFHFGKYILLAAALNMVITQLDNLAIGAQLGAAALGIYMIAYRMSEIPKLVITQTAFRALYPYYSEQHRAGVGALRTAWLQATRSIRWLVVGAYVPMVLCAEFFIGLLFGDQWLRAVPILVVLALLGALRTGNRALLPVLMTLRKTRVDAAYKLLEAGLFVPGVYIGLAWTGHPVGAAWAGVFALSVGMLLRGDYVRRALEVSLAQIAGLLGRPLLGAALSAAVALALLQVDWHPLIVAIVMSAVWLAALMASERVARRWVLQRVSTMRRPA